MKAVKAWKEWSKKKKAIFVVNILLILLIIGIVIYFIVIKKQTADNMSDSMTLDNGMVQATGTTATAILSEELDIESLDTTLYIEDIYLSSGQTVEAGQKILKISDESIAAASKELQQKASEAEIAYKQQLISYEQSKIEAKRDADITAANGNYADTEYSVSLQQAQTELTDLEKQVSDANDLVAEYTDAIDNNYYYTYYHVKELQDECYENFALLMKLYEEWNIADSSTMGSAGNSGTSTSMMGVSQGAGGGYDNASIYSSFDTEVSEEIEERDEAIDNYESALKKAKYSIENAKAQYELLNAQLQEEYANLEKDKITLQTERDTTKAEAELAESSYETELKKLQEELNTVSDANDTAQENLNNFENAIGDGYLYTENAGTITRINARKEDSLTVNMPIIEYSDTETVTVSVSVDQSDIANVSVGAAAIVNISNLGRYDGTVTSISPVSQSDSRSSVYYTVTVTLSGDLSEISSNLTATVMIGGEQGGKESKAKTADSIEKPETTDIVAETEPETKVSE